MTDATTKDKETEKEDPASSPKTKKAVVDESKIFPIIIFLPENDLRIKRIGSAPSNGSLSIPIVQTETDPNKPFVLRSVDIEVGANEHISLYDWRLIENHPEIRTRIDNHSLELVMPDGSDDGGLARFTDLGKCYRLIQYTEDYDRLLIYQRLDKRAEVQKMLSERLTQIEERGKGRR